MAAQTLTVTVDDGGSYTVDVHDVALFSDAGLSTPVTFPRTVSADTTWYAAAPAGRGRRRIEVKVTAVGGDGSVVANIPPIEQLPATVNAPSCTVDYSAPSPSGGSSAVGAPVVRAFPFTFDTPGLVTGHVVYTPTIGDVLLDAWVEIIEEWDGTTPLGDVAAFGGNFGGWWGWDGPGALDMSAADTVDELDQWGLLRKQAQGPGPVSLLSAATIQNSSTTRSVPATFVTDDPIKVCVSQNGHPGGASPASTQGSAVLYLVTVTPATA